MTKQKLFYISCPIYYANAKPHLGHLHSTLYADIIARYQREQQKKVFFITGSDQHGHKIAQAAEKKQQLPEQFVAEQVQTFLKLWAKVGISYTHFVQTHSSTHQQFVKDVFNQLLQDKHLYLTDYQGFYCFSCESFLPGQQKLLQVEGKDVCPSCQKPVSFLQEKNFFFKVLPNQKQQLLSFFDQQKVNNPAAHWFKQFDSLLAMPSLDFSITRNRSSLTWGVPLDKPFSDQIAYVWIDALLSYWSCLTPEWRTKLWADPDTEIVQVLGKEITKFHFIYWPLMCWTQNYRLTNHFVVHGWLLNQGQKMSKSVPITVIDPELLIKDYGVSVLRIYLASLMNCKVDVRFDLTLLQTFYQTYIVNNLSNYCYRVLAMIKKYQPHLVANPTWDPRLAKEQKEVKQVLKGFIDQYHLLFKKFAIGDVCQVVFNLLDYGNQWIEQKKPWTLAQKDDQDLLFVLFHCLLIMKVVAVFLRPIAPDLSEQILTTLNLETTVSLGLVFSWDSVFNVNKVVKLFE